jgi:hypothetical protein
MSPHCAVRGGLITTVPDAKRSDSLSLGTNSEKEIS